jgi:hypothetical protein
MVTPDRGNHRASWQLRCTLQGRRRGGARTVLMKCVHLPPMEFVMGVGGSPPVAQRVGRGQVSVHLEERIEAPRRP